MVDRRMPSRVSLVVTVLVSLALLVSSGSRLESRMMLFDPVFLPLQDAGLYEA
ncbi:MAG: hypothetical protein M3O99_08715 [Chloroflexota bacterium]|nr:hypothetical protein [Chloroflexota bacterium]